MSTAHSQTLAAALAQSRQWSDWSSYLSRTLRTNDLPSGETTVDLLRRFLDAKGASGMVLLKLLRRYFAIDRLSSDDTYGPPLPGEGWVRVDRPFAELFRRDAHIAIGEATSSRRHSVEAHEIAHLFYATLAERAGAIPLDHRVRTDKAERFCWEFSLQVFCPKGERLRWSAGYLSSLLRPREQDTVSQLTPKELRRLTFWHIRALAQRHAISMRMVVVALDRHPLLDEVEFGLAILRRMPNPATSHDIGLRVWQRATPSWGFLVPNQRAVKQGFISAEKIFDRSGNQDTFTVQERLRLKYSCPNQEVKWPIHTKTTTCAYTPVDVKSEGRYLLVMWPWPRLDK